MPTIEELKDRLNMLTLGKRVQSNEHLREILTTSQLLGTLMAQRTQPLRQESHLTAQEHSLHHLKRLKMYMAE